MEWNSIIQFGLGIVVAVIGYFYKEIKTKGDSTELALLNYKLHVSETYVSKDELAKVIEIFNKNFDEVKAGVARIETHLFMGQDRRRP